jgi:hypothetical protein
VPSTLVVDMSPIVTGSSAPPGLARSCSTIAADSSMPVTGTPRAASGSPTRPVPIANSSAGAARRERLEPVEGGRERLGGEHCGAVVVVAGGDLGPK